MSIPSTAANAFTALIVAGGSSRRMGFDKLLAPLAGRSVLCRSVGAFCSLPECRQIVVVCRPERRAQFQALTGSLAAEILFADAGAERQDSVANGLALIAGIKVGQEQPRKWVAIHDAARPLVSARSIRLAVAEAALHGAAALASPVTDTLMRTDEEAVALGPVSRERLWAMQTPQVFDLEQILAAVEKARREGRSFTDEVSALVAAGGKVRLVANPDWNPKITFPYDLALAEAMLSSPNATAFRKEDGE